MNFNLESIIESAIEYRTFTLSRNIFSAETSKRYDEVADELEEVLSSIKEDVGEINDKILRLMVESSEDGFEEGFKTACNLIHSLLVPMKNSKDNIFNDINFLEMVSCFMDTNNLNMSPDSMKKILDTQDEMILKSLPKSEAIELLDYTYDVNNQICAEGVATGLNIGINLMKYLMK